MHNKSKTTNNSKTKKRQEASSKTKQQNGTGDCKINALFFFARCFSVLLLLFIDAEVWSFFLLHVYIYIYYQKATSFVFRLKWNEPEVKQRNQTNVLQDENNNWMY